YHRPSGTAVHRGEHYWLRTYRVTNPMDDTDGRAHARDDDGLMDFEPDEPEDTAAA
ncbi:unnamed protein product, partial [Pylaiella littoralis]